MSVDDRAYLTDRQSPIDAVPGDDDAVFDGSLHRLEPRTSTSSVPFANHDRAPDSSALVRKRRASSPLEDEGRVSKRPRLDSSRAELDSEVTIARNRRHPQNVIGDIYGHEIYEDMEPQKICSLTGRPPDEVEAALCMVKLARGPVKSNNEKALAKLRPKNRINIFKGIIKRPQILQAFIARCSLKSLISLYSMSKAFHFLFNSHMTTFILSAVRWQTGLETEHIFPFSAYSSLCVSDPVRRDIHAENTALANQLGGSAADANAAAANPYAMWVAPARPPTRQIPSLRYLAMALHHDHIAQGIVVHLGRLGHRLPIPPAIEVLKKIWFTMDVATNANRIGLFHNRSYWTDFDLRVARIVICKIDMCFSGNGTGNGIAGFGMHRLFFAQRSLTPLFEALKSKAMGEDDGNELDVLMEWAKWEWVPHDNNVGLDVLDVYDDELGQLDREGWGQDFDDMGQLLRPDELVVKEMIRRKLRANLQLLHCLLWGYRDPKTRARVPRPKLGRASNG